MARVQPGQASGAYVHDAHEGVIPTAAHEKPLCHRRGDHTTPPSPPLPFRSSLGSPPVTGHESDAPVQDRPPWRRPATPWETILRPGEPVHRPQPELDQMSRLAPSGSARGIGDLSGAIGTPTANVHDPVAARGKRKIGQVLAVIPFVRGDGAARESRELPPARCFERPGRSAPTPPGSRWGRRSGRWGTARRGRPRG